MTLRFSILTPSYGYARFIGDTIASIRAQALPSVEHVIADGASVDGTVDILDRTTDLVWTSEPDLGQSDALNRALALSSGDIIGWLNADEFYLPSALRRVASAFEDPSVDVVYGDAAFVDETGNFLRLLPQHRFSSHVLRHYGCFIPSCAVFFRRHLLGEGPWDIRAKQAMDWDLYLALADQGATFRHIPVALGAFRVHDARVTATPMLPDDPERVRIQKRHGIVQSGLTERFLARPTARGLHAALKFTSKSYTRQRHASKYRGCDARWWDEHREKAASSALVRL